MKPPVQVIEPDIATVPTWKKEEPIWKKLNSDAFGNPEFHSITIKAMYVLGVMHSICTSVTCLLSCPPAATYLSAYGVFASGIDLLGRCIQGNKTENTSPQSGAPSDLKEGFRWLADSYFSGPAPEFVIQTSSNQYTIKDMVTLRHFAAHGQATTRYDLQDIDYEIIECSKPLLFEGLNTYWERLKNGDQTLSNNLAKANVRGFRTIPVEVILRLFSPDSVTNKYRSVLELFNDEFNWKIPK